MSTTPFASGTILGYPRIGANRELKRALEAHWAGRIDADELARTAKELRAATWQRLHNLGLAADDASIPADFSYYDHVLDALVVTGALPERFAEWIGEDGALSLAGYFAAARGAGSVAPLEMTKWFDTNYHYLVPEIGPDTEFSLGINLPARLFAEGLSRGFVTRPYLVGPVTLLALAKPAFGAPEGFSPLSRLDDVLDVYEQVLSELAELDAPWIQLDESALGAETLGLTPAELAEAASRAYERLAGLSARPKILVQASYAGLDESESGALAALGRACVDAIALDLVRGSLPAAGSAGAAALEGRVVLAGVVDGHNVWRTAPDEALAAISELAGLGALPVASTSTSLFHVPHTLEAETKLPAHVRSWLAFADEKVTEVTALAGVASGTLDASVFDEARAALASRDSHEGVHRPDVAERLASLAPEDFEREAYAQRAGAQAEALGLPALPTTTIGSFPQVAEIRSARAAFARSEISAEEYREAMRGHIREVIALQEAIGLDVLVHGEAERNDMVQYFAENFEGFDVTENGWVQSYGSRCTRPSLLWGDVVRAEPFTVEWISYAQQQTDKLVKGMLTGPVTILAWSFVRRDQPLETTANQVALALRDEIADLEAAGIRIIQVDEPAIRELLPLKKTEQEDYLEWSVRSFRLATSGVKPQTQIHTHLCYSEFGQIFEAIDALDADVTSIEAERSKMEIVADIEAAGFERGIGPGVYDIHSPRIPSQSDVEALLETALASIPASQLWVNPDCGLKTRRYEEVVPALTAMVAAARAARARLA